MFSDWQRDFILAKKLSFMIIFFFQEIRDTNLPLLIGGEGEYGHRKISNTAMKLQIKKPNAPIK